ncbi:TPA: receptor-recognizing protein [Enterobacter cloacae]
MAISNPVTGLSVKAETGQTSMDKGATVVRVTKRPFWLSSLKSLSKEIPLTIGYNQAFDSNWLIGVLRGHGDTPVVITITGHLASKSVSMPCLNFPGDLKNAYVRININSGVKIMGKGGSGGGDNYLYAPPNTKNNDRYDGQQGGPAIYNGIGARLQISNGGTIGGGGGGGGAIKSSSTNSSAVYQGGGGGYPMGDAGYCKIDGHSGYHSGKAGNMTVAGAGGQEGAWSAGSGGGLGGKGGNANNNTRGRDPGVGGAGGKAVYGSKPNWLARGSVVGSSDF